MGGSSSKIIVIVGPYGCGKSQFIDCLTQKTSWASHGLKPTSQSVRSTKVKMRDRETVVVVDAPGFDDTATPADYILQNVKDWLRQKYKNEQVTGILYLHNITDNRLTTPPPRHILTRLFGEAAARRLMFVTTHWDRVNPARGEARERQFQSFLESFMGTGVPIMRSNMSQERAFEIMEMLISQS